MRNETKVSPGRTVARKEGVFNFNHNKYRLVDLPGTYSLTANSTEEVITQEFIVREHPDVVLVLVNAAALELNLYLVAELIVLSAPIVVVLMWRLRVDGMNGLAG